MKCGLESTLSHYKSRHQLRSRRGPFTYRPGRDSKDFDSSPSCMSEVYKRMARAARITLSAIAKHFRLRSDAFNHFLDDTPMVMNTCSSSGLVASYNSDPNGSIGNRRNTPHEIVNGFLVLITSASHGVQVCDPNERWIQANNKIDPGDLILVTGKALAHVTGGLRPAATYKIVNNYSTNGISSLIFNLMPHNNALLDCSQIMAAGHLIPQNYGLMLASRYSHGTSSSGDHSRNSREDTNSARSHFKREQSFRSILLDPFSGGFLEDAMVVSCGHSFGGLELESVIDMEKCPICYNGIAIDSSVPNLALRNAAAIVKSEEESKANARKRRYSEEDDNGQPADREGSVGGWQRANHCPYSTNDMVVVVGNLRTSERYVGKQGIVISTGLNGWCLLQMCESGEEARFQFRSLRRVLNPQPIQRFTLQDLTPNSSP